MKRLWVVAALATLAALPCRAAAQTEISCPAGVPEPQLRVLEGEPFSIDGDVLTVRAVVEAPCALTDATTATATAPWGAEGSDDVPALRSGGRAPVEIELAIPAGESGERQITVSVPRGFDDDPDFQSEESNAALGDNAREITVTLPGAKTPDLAVRPADEPSGTPDGRVELFAVVANEGDAAARPTTATVRTPWGAELEVDVPALTAGGEAPVDAGFDVPADRRGTTADFDVAVDAVRREVDLADNATTIRDVALPGGGSSGVPDLAVGRLRLAPQTDPASAGVLAVVRNEGDAATAAGRARLSAGWGDAVRQDVPALEPGATAALRFRLPVPPAQRGRRRGLAVAVRPAAGETDTADNRAVIVPRLIAAAPDGPDGGFPVWPAVAALALALAAAALLARRLWRGGKTPPLTAPPLREIETGFEAGHGPLPDGEPLVPGADYQFWLRVGPPVTSGAGRRLRAEVALTTLAGGLAAAPPSSGRRSSWALTSPRACGSRCAGAGTPGPRCCAHPCVSRARSCGPSASLSPFGVAPRHRRLRSTSRSRRSSTRSASPTCASTSSPCCSIRIDRARTRSPSSATAAATTRSPPSTGSSSSVTSTRCAGAAAGRVATRASGAASWRTATASPIPRARTRT